MSMTIREQWRQAALRDQQQVFVRDPAEFRGTQGLAHCAISLVWDDRDALAQRQPEPVRCPVDGCAFTSRYASTLAIHLNNVERWDWLTLASKFPPILPEDQEGR